LVGRIAAIIGVALITGITASVVIVVQRKSENITEGI
jgi:Flp pilus assembly pilin Flp